MSERGKREREIQKEEEEEEARTSLPLLKSSGKKRDREWAELVS